MGMIVSHLSSCILVVFSSLLLISPSTSAANAAPAKNQEEDAMESFLLVSRKLQDIKPSTNPALKCKNSDSKLQLEIETIGGSSIPFYCEWAMKGKYSCSETGALASHCPNTCRSCS